MCGIDAAVSPAANIVPVLLEGLRKLDYRGDDSADIAVLNDAVELGQYRHYMQKEIFEQPINDTFEQRGLPLKVGTMVDATIIHAPPSTKNRYKQRDPEMPHTKKGNQWYFGMKVHVGADISSGLVHTISVTPANISDINHVPHLVREEDRAAFGDKGYVGNKLKRLAHKAGLFWGVSLEASKQRPLTEANKRFNHKQPSIRARIEHVFRVIKRQFGYTKVHYKEIAKNAEQVFSLIGSANLYLARLALID